MLEQPHPAILDRQEAISVAQEHFSPQIDLLRDLANYGSSLVIRTYTSSTKQLSDVVVCGVLLKQVVSMVDAAQVLLAAGCVHAAFLQARAAFEASLYVSWVLSANSERRAKLYIVGNFRNERIWASKVIPGTTENQAFEKIAQTLGLDIHAKRPSITADANAHLAEVNRLLNQSDLQPIDLEYDKARGKKANWDKEWYELDGIRSIRKMAEDVSQVMEYDHFYSKGSKVTHTGSYKDHIRFSNGHVSFMTIRHLSDVNLLINFLMSICIKTYKQAIERYRPGGVTAFSQKYLEDWQKPFMTTKTVVTKFN